VVWPFLVRVEMLINPYHKTNSLLEVRIAQPKRFGK
jgi:hypothetical protein